MSTPISSTVMRRVRTVHALRPLLSSTALGAAVFLIALWGIGREVWVAHVFQNLAIVLDHGNLATYLVAAFMNTRFVVQVLSVLTIGAAIWLVRDGLRSLSYSLKAA